MSVGNNSNQQKKVLLLASLISLAIHASIILVLSEAKKYKIINRNKKTITIELVEINTKQEIITTLNPKKQPSIKKKIPEPIRQLKPRVDKQTASQKTKGEPARTKPSPQPNRIKDTASQTTKETDVAATATSNTSGSDAVNKNTSQTSSKESTSIVLKETPRCLQCVDPEKPRRLEKRGIESYAIFKLYISASGNVLKAELLNSSGHTSFINSCRKAAMSSTFYPMAQQNTLDIFYSMKIENK